MSRGNDCFDVLHSVTLQWPMMRLACRSWSALPGSFVRSLDRFGTPGVSDNEMSFVACIHF